jgi:dTDP-4-dehydrorhamnose reductase
MPNPKDDKVSQKRIYVTGGSGLVGSNLIKVAVERYHARVFATMHRWHPPQATEYEFGTVDITNRDQVLRSVQEFGPDAIIHCAVVFDLPLIYSNRHVGWQAYVESARHLVEAANDVGAKIIQISSDWVFDGTQSIADETTPPNPINYYGVLKLTAETLVSAMAQDWAVARTAGVNGVHWARPAYTMKQNPGFGNLATAIAHSLGEGQSFTVWQGEVNWRGTPTLASELGEMIMRIINRNGQGIFHCCGGESVSRLELVQAAARALDLDPALIRVGPPDRATTDALTGIPIPRDTSLSSDRTARSLAYTPPTLIQALDSLRTQMETGRI